MTTTRSRKGHIPRSAVAVSLRTRKPRPGAVSRVRRKLRSTDSVAGWTFSLPATALIAVFLILPFVLAILLSFTNYRLLSPLPTRWVGWQNYTRTFEDPIFRRALINNCIFTVVVVPLQTALALLLAILVNQKLRGITIFRTIYFAPVVVVMAVAATVWRLLYDPDQGLINAFLRMISAGQLHSDWLMSTKMALPAIMLMSIWQGAGFQMIILLAGLQAIPQELYEAAQVDGATTWQQFRCITLPQLRNTLTFVVTISTILAFRLFDQVYVMTRGGPLNSTETMMLRLVDVGFNEQKIGQASAIAVIFFLIVLAVTLVSRLLIREEERVR
jgi:multiple sugar transport system permease protein